MTAGLILLLFRSIGDRREIPSQVSLANRPHFSRVPQMIHRSVELSRWQPQLPSQRSLWLARFGADHLEEALTELSHL